MQLVLSRREAKNLAELLQKMIDLDYVTYAEAEEYLDSYENPSLSKLKIISSNLEGRKSKYSWDSGVIKILFEEVKDGK